VPGNEVLAGIRAWQHRDPPLPKST
jgi:hypothetical protein